ncbi:spore germination protein [Mycoplasmatota bacterium]|nr:spore germination protein [Mycoplasmatota bacterium]
MKKIRTDIINLNKKVDLPMEVESFKGLFANSHDCVFTEVMINKELTVHLVFVDGLANCTNVMDFILKPLTTLEKFTNIKDEKKLIDVIKGGSLYYISVKETNDVNLAVELLLMGTAVLILKEAKIAFLFETRGFESRSIQVPTEETSLKGSKDAFVETLRTNTAMLRRKMRTPDLVIEELIVGKVSKTKVSVSYIDGIANDQLVKSLRERLKKIETDQVLFTTVIEEEIIDSQYTPFPQVEYTEKPDKFCSALLEGRIGIIIDGIPFTMIIPTSIVNFFQTTDDYSHNYIVVSIIRGIRYLLAAVALIVPAFYVAITSFHLEMIPEGLALSVISTEKGVPFPIFIECILLSIAFQTLIEAGARIWSSIGGMVSLVGALIVGEAAITANFISPGVVVVVAAAAIANYTIPNKDFAFAIWIWEIILILLSSVIGLYGMVIGIILLIHHWAQMEVMGEPYLAPFAATDGRNSKDAIIRSLFVFKKKESLDEQSKINE